MGALHQELDIALSRAPPSPELALVPPAGEIIFEKSLSAAFSSGCMCYRASWFCALCCRERAPGGERSAPRHCTTPARRSGTAPAGGAAAARAAPVSLQPSLHSFSSPTFLSPLSFPSSLGHCLEPLRSETVHIESDQKETMKWNSSNNAMHSWVLFYLFICFVLLF